MRVSAVTTTMILVLIASGCTESDGGERSTGGSEATRAEMNAKKEVGDAVQAVKALAAENADGFQSAMQVKLAALDEKVAQLKRRAKAEAAAGKKELEEQMRSLAEKREALEKQLDELGAATESAWQDVASGLEAAYDDLERSVAEAARHFDEAQSANGDAGAEKESR